MNTRIKIFYNRTAIRLKKQKDEIFQIGDFGLCRTLINDAYTSKGGPLPIKWMAPESLQRMEFSTKSDVLVFFLA
jgi:hypothetical protein